MKLSYPAFIYWQLFYLISEVFYRDLFILLPPLSPPLPFPLIPLAPDRLRRRRAHRPQRSPHRR
jgi:hypothetical protein